mmetsp:Transcript_17040/g.28448  ORF Transcript_17040/g.28448 Transcript_17040/m.28448 type:complete len:240 (-) Transcript_17040:115-834(-)|eukprot:CAMPEP_0114434808 /NCGR_PEP_ID=MMETSP0103-20121206/12470_1 /TAXON_ID=37642 ORGANISM="Paraphysomonas imperforata, Strain PA2" /NCGR_SAMPLE_ID=MMETSP0103 /ASSEMBLY_ACC=CAM_ASM_000201 /LENGTH=239 /DNA_ID=CAMNT_0001604743 /DNA_START=10 /DNA_END=729 /DNA_ORIENTATION=+
MSKEGEGEGKRRTCIKCNERQSKNKFKRKQWEKHGENDSTCRTCEAYNQTSKEMTRDCARCGIAFGFRDYMIGQWERGEGKSECPTCSAALTNKIVEDCLSNKAPGVDVAADGTTRCSAHGNECCDICCMDFSFTNKVVLREQELGRKLADGEHMALAQKNLALNHDICVLDHMTVCPRTGKRLRCKCKNVAYCSKECQDFHWPLHKFECRMSRGEAIDDGKYMEALMKYMERTQNMVR